MKVADRHLAVDERKAFSASERETFLAAIGRHRRASWRVTAACAVAVVMLTLVVATLMSPLLYALIGLGFDLVNLVTPTPDLLGSFGRQIDALLSSKNVSAVTIVHIGVVASLPGLALMGVIAYALRRVWRISPLFNVGDVTGRPPDRTLLAEERLANIVEEMAIAAGIPVPRVIIVPGGINAAACGRDQDHVTLLVGDALADCLNREQIEGMIAHLVGSIVNGDMTIGLRVTTTLSLFGLLARVGSSFNDRRGIWHTLKLCRVFIAPTSERTVAFLTALMDPFGDAAPVDPAAGPKASGGNNSLTWREWLVMPLMGPVLLTGFLTGLVSQFFLEPLVACAWRQRKYMADATAVQLTRDPDALAGALAAIVQSPTAITAWTAHLAVAADRSGVSGPFGRSMVPIFPSVEKRVAALNRMGAHVSLKAKSPMPWPLVLVFGLAMTVIAALMAFVVYLLVMVSTAISGLFTLFPAAILHFLLRWAAR